MKAPIFKKCWEEIHRHRETDLLLVIMTKKVSDTIGREVGGRLKGGRVYFLANRVINVVQDTYDAAEVAIHAINANTEVVLLTHERIYDDIDGTV